MAKSRQSKRRIHRRRSSKIVIIGGDGAAEYAINTYGGIGQQHAVSATDHTIAVNTASPTIIKGGADLSPALVSGGATLSPALVSGGATLSPALVNGGAVLSPAEYNGGGIITDIAVPAALIYTRNILSNRRLSGFSRLSVGKSQNRRSHRKRSHRKRSNSRR